MPYVVNGEGSDQIKLKKGPMQLTQKSFEKPAALRELYE